MSCQKIVGNLLKAYRLKQDVEIVPVLLAKEMDDYTLYNSVQTVVRTRPSHVIFLDHQPNPAVLIKALIPYMRDLNFHPHFIFHLYGDFTLNFNLWKGLEEFIKNEQVLWYAASDRQRAMLSEFIPLEQIELCPFPVDAQEFFVDGELRQTLRRQHNWESDQKIFLFTGRLSRQKRIHQLIQVFSEWRAQTGARAKLVLVGDADKVGEPFLLRGEYEGEYFHYLQDVYHALPAEEQGHIEFHGFRPNRELNAYYNAADCLVNMSVHNDEDYGMSCAEALAAGLPMILTNWAGLVSFRRDGLEQDVRLVPVKLTRRGKLIALKRLREALEDFYRRSGEPDRAQIARLSLEYTGVAPVAKIVTQGLQKGHTFTGFEPNLYDAARLEFYQNWNTFAVTKTKTFNDLYMQVYSHYVE